MHMKSQCSRQKEKKKEGRKQKKGRKRGWRKKEENTELII